MTDGTDLPATLGRALEARPDGPLCVAFSGGPDSTALLHALAGLPAARARGLRALHVDHRLHPDSGAWAEHARAVCRALDIACAVVAVTVERTGAGLEAAARRARYAACGQALQPGEWLLLGHHRDDQVETVLLKLLRGAGPDGLGGMRAERPLGAGRLWRPLLELSREVLRDYLAANGLEPVEDPSNADTRLARNHLRQVVLPALAGHWPQAADSIVHSARLCRSAADALREQWLGALDELLDPATGSLACAGWLALAPALREPLLDHWLHTRGLSAPTAAQRREIARQCTARPGQAPCLRWPGTELRIWRGRLWAHPPRPPLDPGWSATWRGEPLELPDGGRLWLEPARPLPRPLRVALRRGGERIRPAGDPHTRELRDLFQQGDVPPWQREACPLLYDGNALLAVADRWYSLPGHRFFDAIGAWPHWHPLVAAHPVGERPL